MDLWQVFPEFLLQIDGILLLPYVSILFYLYIFYVLLIYPGQRLGLIVFVLLTLVASVIMSDNIRPKNGDFVPPLALIIVMAIPLFMLMIQLSKQSYIAARICVYGLLRLWQVGHIVSAGMCGRWSWREVNHHNKRP